MSHWTTEVRFICENAAGLVESTGFNNVNDVLDKSWDKVFNFDFPLFDDSYRKTLCVKILRHFYTREICEETVGLWKLRLEDRLNMVMPYYNQLYASELIKINPLYTANYTKDHADSGGDVRVVNETTTGNETGNETNKGTRDTTNNETTKVTGTNYENATEVTSGTSENTSSTTTTGNSKESIESIVDTSTTVNRTHSTTSEQTNVSDKTETLSQRYSDTPQGGLNGINDNTYLTNVTLNNNDVTQETKNNVTENGTENNTTTGNSTTNQTTNRETSGTTNVSDNGKTSGNKTNEVNGSNEENGSKNDVGKIVDDYATTSNRDTSGTHDLNDTITTTRAYIEHVVGSNNRSDSSLLNEYRTTFINIDEMVINELNDLFMNIW